MARPPKGGAPPSPFAGVHPAATAACAGTSAETLAGHLQVIAAQLWAVAANPGALEAGLLGHEAMPDQRELLVALVERDYRERRARDTLFGAQLFGEPAWDMLLYLYAAQLRGDLVVTSSLVRASAVPATTALRWITLLERAHLIERCAIKRDGRVRVQRLTRAATARLDDYFARRLASIRPVLGSSTATAT